MNILRRCVRATATLLPPLSLSSRSFLNTVTRSSPYSTNQLGPEHSSSSIRWPEVNEQAKEPIPDSSHPRKIPYQVKVANLVKLLGHIKLPVKFQSFRDGKHYAATFISDAYKPIDKACLIPVLFEGDLAHVVSCHIKENDCVYVTGKLSSGPFPFVLQENQFRLHILAEDINFVEGYDEKAYDYSRNKEIVDNVKNSRSKTSAQDLWRDLMNNPNQWMSFVDDKSKGFVSPKHPDFKHTENAASLWLRSAPKWFLARIENLDSDTYCSKEKMWKSLAENPDQWLNYAKHKSKGLVSPEYPDFLNTENGSALWLDRAPEWFLGGIENLDLDTCCSKEKMWKSLAENPDQWWDYRTDKRTEKAPDFKHKKTGVGLWLGDSPEWFVAKVIGKLKDAKAEAWKSLVENPSEWWDNRLKKINVKSPDFKHKDSEEGLWLERAPDWVVSKLPPLKQNQYVGGV